MPELPEVEHVVRALRAAVTGREIISAQLRLPRIAPELSKAQFGSRLRRARINDVRRRGKYIVFDLSNGKLLLTHLRMTGKFLSLGLDEELPPHAHVVFFLDNDRRLVFCDMRQFGRMLVVEAKKFSDTKQIKELAPEPLSEDFSLDYLADRLSKSRRPIKHLLLDQTKVLGLGNIYAAEALYLARISPFAIPADLSKKRVERLHSAIIEILQTAIDGGSTLRINLDEEGNSYIGSSERFWRVYEREAEPCERCGARIRRVTQAGRSTYYCPRCQRR